MSRAESFQDVARYACLCLQICLGQGWFTAVQKLSNAAAIVLSAILFAQGTAIAKALHIQDLRKFVVQYQIKLACYGSRGFHQHASLADLLQIQINATYGAYIHVEHNDTCNHLGVC